MSADRDQRDPMVTVLMPVHNAAVHLREAITSTLAQTCADFDFLIINDGSTDASADVVRSFQDPRIRLVEHQQNRGLVAVLNEGIGMARGRYIARMDADDVMHADRLEKQLRYLEEHPNIALVATFVDFINTDGEVTGVWDIDRKATTEAEIRSMMPRTTCIAHPSVMIRRDALGALRYVRYDARQTEGEDWDLWLRMLSRGLRMVKIPEALLYYRQHPRSLMGINKAVRPAELRSLVTRHRFLLAEWKNFRSNKLHVEVLRAQVRSLARHMKVNIVPRLLSSTRRILTYSPIQLLRQRRDLRRVLANWKGHHLFLFPYLGMGGAEQVHAGMAASVSDKDPLIIITGFSADRAFEDRFATSGTVLEIPHLLNHPWTHHAALSAIARKMNSLSNAVVLGALTGSFFDLLPKLEREVRTYYAQHAFLYQPDANLQHKKWLKHYDRVDGYVLTSDIARIEFDKFLFHQNIPASRAAKLIAAPSAAPVFGEVRVHQRTGILFVGRDSPEKRLALFLRITADLEAKFPGRFRFTVAGAEYRDGYPQVEFKGIIRDPDIMSSLYSDHDLFVLTSTREGHCLVVTEAMAHGLVVLSTPVGDVPGRVDPATGILTSTTDGTTVLKEMVDGIIALENDRTRMHHLKVAALAKIRETFAPEKFDQFYRELLTSPAS